MKLCESIALTLRLEKDCASQIKLHYLRKTDIFCDLAPEELQDVARIATLTVCPPGKVLYSPDEKGEASARLMSIEPGAIASISDVSISSAWLP